MPETTAGTKNKAPRRTGREIAQDALDKANARIDKAKVRVERATHELDAAKAEVHAAERARDYAAQHPDLQVENAGHQSAGEQSFRAVIDNPQA